MREKVKLLSTAGTGHFYVATKNKRLHPDKMEREEIRSGRAQARRRTRNRRSSNRLAPQVAQTIGHEKSPASHLAGLFLCLLNTHHKQ